MRTTIFAIAMVTSLIGIGAACATVADLDVTYNADAGSDALDDGAARQKVRESSVEKPDVEPLNIPGEEGLPCEGNLGFDAGEDPLPGRCDNGAGRGCCLTATTHNCIEQKDVEDLCLQKPGGGTRKVFVGCRQSDPDNPCCWIPRGDSFVARFAGACDGGTMACISDAGCFNGQPCTTTTCSSGLQQFVIGQCAPQPPSCPQ